MFKEETNNMTTNRPPNELTTNKPPKNKKPILLIFASITTISTLALLIWLINIIIMFANRTIGLMDTFFLVLVGIPVLLVVTAFLIAIIFSIICLVDLLSKKSKKYFSLAKIIILSSSMIVGSVLITFSSFGFISIMGSNAYEWYFNDSMRPTDDGLFEYRLELVFPFQRNARLRLFVRDVVTGEEFHVPIDVDVGGIGGVVAASGGEFQRRIIWARMMPAEEFEQYLLIMPARRAFNDEEIGFGWVRIDGAVYNFHNLHAIGDATFLIDIPNRTSTRID